MFPIYTTLQTEFVIISDDFFDPHEITKLLGIEPDRFWIKGEPTSWKPHHLHRSTLWQIHTPEEKQLEVTEQLNQIYQRIVIKKQELLEIQQMYDVAFNLEIVVQIMHQQMPGIVIPAHVLQFLGEIGADIDIDMYYLGDDNEMFKFDEIFKFED